jgi:hypothetical protein
MISQLESLRQLLLRLLRLLPLVQANLPQRGRMTAGMMTNGTISRYSDIE